jgi:hypothetical protein
VDIQEGRKYTQELFLQEYKRIVMSTGILIQLPDKQSQIVSHSSEAC